LESDFKLFPQGDRTEVGERGITVSGGQKARLSLARAVYSRADIYLLDDPISAVDAKVARKIYHDVIQGILKQKTVLLVTHQVHYLTECDQLLIMNEGSIERQGTPRELYQ
jgi:ATP-binding cassette subfamily C (CFTR/MRP) protein 4